DRMLVVQLPPGIPTDSVLRITLLGSSSSEGLVRLYNQVQRDTLERQVAARSLDLEEQRDKLASNTYDPWSMVPRMEQLSRMRYATERLSAIGEHGIDYDTQVIYYTGFRLPLDVFEVDETVEVHEHRFAAINV